MKRCGLAPTAHSSGNPKGNVDAIQVPTESASRLDEPIVQSAQHGKTVVWFHDGQVETAHIPICKLGL